VFDDPRVGLDKEPFVSGADDMIDVLVADIPNADKGFRLLFAADAVSRTYGEIGMAERGVWRELVFLAGIRNGRLVCARRCSNIFDKAPKEIYVKAEPRSK